MRERLITTALHRLPPDLQTRLHPDEPMAQHTSFCIGGPADWYACPHTAEEVRLLLAWAQDLGLEVTVVGRGSNLLVADKGIRGLVIALDTAFADMAFVSREELDTLLVDAPQRDEWRRYCESLPRSPTYTDFGSPPILLRAQAGAPVAEVSALARRHGLTGLEFACGIPGSVGGAVYMNAGAYGNSIQDVVFLTRSINRFGTLNWTLGAAHDFAYRASFFSRAGHIVLESYFCLRPGHPEEVENSCHDYTERRQKTQPLELPSAGSMFKRPQGYFAGQLISEAGLKGYRVGDAAVSEKHAGFVVNLGAATAEQVRHLVRDIQQRVYETSGVLLETEVRFIGDWEQMQ